MGLRAAEAFVALRNVVSIADSVRIPLIPRERQAYETASTRPNLRPTKMMGSYNAMTCRVVHLTSVHRPFDTRIFHKECKSLAKAGYDVTLVAPYAEGDLTEDGIKLRAVALPHDRRERVTRTIREIYRAALQEDAEIYHFHDPELMPVGVLLKLHGKKVIYDVHEDYSTSMQGKQWIPSVLHRPASVAVSICEATLAAACDRVVAATPIIAKRFHPGRTRLVQNFPWRWDSAPLTGYPMRNARPLWYMSGLCRIHAASAR